MKNHEYVNGRLLQTNKTFSHLKESQKTKISEWMYEEYKKYCAENGKEPSGKAHNLVVVAVLNRIEQADIWIPDEEIYKHYERKVNRLRKRYARELVRNAEGSAEKSQ